MVPPVGIKPTCLAYMAGGPGIEPGSPALQAGADVTRLAHHRESFCIQLVQLSRAVYRCAGI